MEEEVKRGKVTAPERRAERIIKKCLKREISRKMPQIITTGHVLKVLPNWMRKLIPLVRQRPAMQSRCFPGLK